METMHAAGRRRLPPVPRPAAERPNAGVLTVDAPGPVDAEPVVEVVAETLAETPVEAGTDDATSDTEVIDTRLISGDQIDAELARLVEQATPDAPPAAEVADDAPDPAQQFVARLRAAAADFAGAAGAESAVVREAVPPARHRRARCRLVLRYADGREVDVTMLGPAGAPGRPSRHGFDRQILRWLGGGLVQDDAWMVSDPDAPGGIAVDLTAWAATG